MNRLEKELEEVTHELEIIKQQEEIPLSLRMQQIKLIDRRREILEELDPDLETFHEITIKLDNHQYHTFQNLASVFQVPIEEVITHYLSRCIE